MSRAAGMAFAAAGLGVAGAWELLAAVERARAAAWLRTALRPLARARREGRPPSAPERRRLTLLACGSLFAAGWLVAGPVMAVIATLTGPAASGAVIVSRRRAYEQRLAAEAAAAARALAAPLAAGRSVRSAVEEAARDLDGPAGTELRRTAAALAAGVSTEAALEGLRARARSRAWDTLVAAVLVQRAAGGDLPGLLRELAASQEASARADDDARAATAQARFTARLVAGLPAVALALAELASPGFLAGLLGNPLSLVLLILAGGLQLAAFLAVRAITRRLAAP
jgi:tight adherence protein B